MKEIMKYKNIEAGIEALRKIGIYNPEICTIAVHGRIEVAVKMPLKKFWEYKRLKWSEILFKWVVISDANAEQEKFMCYGCAPYAMHASNEHDYAVNGWHTAGSDSWQYTG